MTAIEPQSIAEVLEWDSTFFARRIGRVRGGVLTPEYAAEIDAWAQRNRVDCIYFLASTGNNQTTAIAEANDYHLMDIRVDLVANIKGRTIRTSPEDPIRFAKESDIPELRTIAGANHTNSRFFADSHFDRNKCTELYQVWIEKSVKGMADRVFVWEEDGRAAGYVTVKMEPDGSGSIGLVGISPACQGKGAGRRLLSASLDYFAGLGATSVVTATQGNNIRALNLYEKSGFIVHSLAIWYHKWFIH